MGPGASTAGASVIASTAASEGATAGSLEHATQSAAERRALRMGRDRRTDAAARELAEEFRRVVATRSVMARVHLLNFNADEVDARAEALREAGHALKTDAYSGSIKVVRDGKPDALVINLARAPSNGTQLAAMVRQSAWGRNVALLFVDGEPEKVERAKKLLPDATYTSWAKVKTALRAALANPLAKPHVPKSLVTSNAPLVKKLAIKPGATVVMIDAPSGFEDALGELPEGVKLRERGVGDLVIWFVRSSEDLERDVERIVTNAGEAPVWIAWKKKSSDALSDLSSMVVLEVGRAMGRSDSKVCAIDATWSAIMFCDASKTRRTSR